MAGLPPRRNNQNQYQHGQPPPRVQSGRYHEGAPQHVRAPPAPVQEDDADKVYALQKFREFLFNGEPPPGDAQKRTLRRDDHQQVTYGAYDVKKVMKEFADVAYEHRIMGTHMSYITHRVTWKQRDVAYVICIVCVRKDFHVQCHSIVFETVVVLFSTSI